LPNTYWHCINEICQDRASLPALNKYEVERMRLAGADYRCLILNFSVGNPAIEDWGLVEPALTLAEQRWDVVGVHQYNWPTMSALDPSWYSARLECRVLPILKHPGLKFVVSEYGLDRLLTGEVGGWQTASARALPGNVFSFMLQERMENYAVLRERDGLREFDETATRGLALTGEQYARMLVDAVNAVATPRVLGYTVFCAGASHPWETYDIAGAAATAIAAMPDTGNSPEELSIMETDPRAQNCRAFHVNQAGKVDGVELVWTPIPSAQYACVLAELIDEEQAQGNCTVTVEVLNQAGIKTAERTLMTWPYGEVQSEDAPIGPGNPNNQFTAESVYPSKKGVGPLGFFVGDKDKQPISDFIWGYGLPDNRHVSGHVVFQERGKVVEPDDPEEPEMDYATLEEALHDEAEWEDVLRVNPDAALCKQGRKLALWPTSNEFPVDFDGVEYTAQRFRDPDSDSVTVLYCITGQWDKVEGLTW